MDTVLIRLAVISDIPEIAGLLIELEHPYSEEGIQRQFELLTLRGDHSIIVAERDGNVIGLMTFHALDLLFEAERLGRITALIVSEAERGKGIGKMLVAKAEELASESGCNRIELTSNIRRTEAHGFYELLGFGANWKRFIKKIVS